MAQTSRLVKDGLMVGIIGSATAAAFYGVFDILAARGAFFTVDLLGKSVFRGLSDSAVLGLPIELDVEAIAMYSGLHVIVSLIVGLVVVGLVLHAEKRPEHAGQVLFMIVGGFLVTIVSVLLMAKSIRPLLPSWSVVMANALAVLAAAVYLLRKHPGVWSRLSPART